MGLTQMRVEQAQVVVNLRGGRNGRARVGPTGPLLNGDGRRQPLDVVDLRLLHLVEELPSVGRKTLHILALPLREQGVEGQRRLPGTAGTRDDHQAVSRDLQRKVLEVVLPRSDDADELLRHGHHPTARTPSGKPVDRKKGPVLRPALFEEAEAPVNHFTKRKNAAALPAGTVAVLAPAEPSTSVRRHRGWPRSGA